MAENDKKPRIRFKGFTDAWEQRKLGEIFKYEQPQPYIVESTKYKDEYETPVLTAGQSFILGYTNEEFGVKKASEKEPLVIFDDFTTSSHYVDFSFKIKSSAMKLLSLNKKTDNIYCAYNILQNIKYVPISHERHWISMFSKFDVMIPKEDEEQRRIGTILKEIDKLITLHRCKDFSLKYGKMLNIRYLKSKIKTNAWEQRKVKDVANRYDNLRIPVAANLRKKGSTPYYGANGIQDYVDGYTHNGEFVLVAEDGANDLKNYPVKCVKGKIWVNNHAHVLQTIPEIADNMFLAFSINQADIESLLVGGGRAKLNAEVLMGIELKFPSKVEQKKIGEYIHNIDKLITLHQRE